MFYDHTLNNHKIFRQIALDRAFQALKTVQIFNTIIPRTVYPEVLENQGEDTSLNTLEVINVFEFKFPLKNYSKK